MPTRLSEIVPDRMERGTQRDTPWAMSAENVAVARRAFRAWNAGDMDALREIYYPRAVMRYHGDWPEPGPFSGRDAIMRQFERMREALDDRDSLVVLGDILHAADRVVIRFAWRGEGYGPAMDFEVTVVYTIRDGRVLEAEFFPDHTDALDAAGLG
jgi:ketosteroid isomerase-like protein